MADLFARDCHALWMIDLLGNANRFFSWTNPFIELSQFGSAAREVGAGGNGERARSPVSTEWI